VFKPISKGLNGLGWAGLEPATFALKGRWQKIANLLIFQRFTVSGKSLYHNCNTDFHGRRQAQATKICIATVPISIEKERSEMNTNEDLPELDRARIEEITKGILLVIRDNYLRGPESRERCFEVLNALAASAALMIEGADGPGGKAQKFFEQALRQHGVFTTPLFRS
jgi:hypothetical protein